ncbi:EF-hand domain-containing protein [Jannaschia helgolandensis]|uniref:EF hand n=1 Tax=Jannaschia helgolandensis TaxID=188906 RepID=A0A1H7Q120_9RHOB|nr:calcium-binding protein [Jannaschia helgolandensis]SEL41017.1 EF hand [Jannaschia helgolandensis]
MVRKTLLTAGILVGVAFGGAAFADADQKHGGQTGARQGGGVMQQGAASGMMGGQGGMSGMMGGQGGMSGMMAHMQKMGGGMMGGMGPMSMMLAFDTDGDGTVSPEELRTGLLAKLGEFDADGDGSLSISEFETLHSAMIRETMVDRFQYLDADGDGIVTAGEMTAPADVMTRMQSMRGGVDQDTSNDSMMNDN